MNCKKNPIPDSTRGMAASYGMAKTKTKIKYIS
jgi:hypothetical protein